MKQFGIMILLAALLHVISSGTAVGADPLPYARFATLKTHRNNAVALSPDGALLAEASRDSTVTIANARTGTQAAKLDGHEREVTAVAFSPDGKILATGSADDFVIFWDTATWKPLRKYRINTTIIALAFSPDGSILAVADYDEAVFLLDPQSGKKIRKLTGHAENVRSIAFSADSTLLASGGDDKRIVLWDVQSGAERMNLKKQPGIILALAISPDGTLLASGGDDGKITIREIPSGKVRTVVGGHRHLITGLRFLDNGKVLASLENKQIAFGEQSCAVKFRDTSSWQEISSLNGACAPSFSFTPDGRYLAVGGEEATIFARSR